MSNGTCTNDSNRAFMGSVLTTEQIRRHLGDRIRAARLAAGHESAVPLAEQLGVTHQAWYMWEGGGSAPGGVTQVKLAALLGVKHSDLFGLDDLAAVADEEVA